MLTSPQSFTSVESVGCSGLSYSASWRYGTTEIEIRLKELMGVLQEIINYIESIEFSCECGLAAGTRLYVQYMETSPKVKALIEFCKDRTVAIFILGHMLDLSLRKYDPHYANPLDCAQTTYLHCLVTGQPELKKQATAAARLMGGTFWVKRYLELYLNVIP